MGHIRVFAGNDNDDNAAITIAWLYFERDELKITELIFFSFFNKKKQDIPMMLCLA